MVNIGDRFGRLVVLENLKVNNRWCCLCKCDCGNEKLVDKGNLVAGRTRSCGCLNREKRHNQNWTKESRERVGKSNSKQNRYEILSDKIKAYTVKGEVFYVSKESEWALKDYCWYMDNTGYLRTRIRGTKNTKMSLHRLLLKGVADGKQIDHIDGNPSNNCLDNLRIVTNIQNQWNKERSKDYCIFKNKQGKYSVKIRYDGKRYGLGTYTTIEEARKVRDEWESKHDRIKYFR